MVQENGRAFKWPKLNQLTPFPYSHNQKFLKITFENIETIGNGSLSGEEKMNFINSKISFCSQMLLDDKVTQAISKAVGHQGKMLDRCF